MRILISDYHAGCQNWQAHTLKELNIDVTVDSYSGHAFTIDDSLKQNITPETRPNLHVGNIKPITSESDIKSVSAYDTVLVSFPPKFIDLYSNINMKYPKILNAGHRLHIHTLNDPDFTKNLANKVKNNEIILCSMSRYDTEYIKHYLDITPIELYVTCFHIPSSISYRPVRDEILISPVNATNLAPFTSINDMNAKAATLGYNFKFSTVKAIYNNYKYEDLINHKATVLFPYSVFSISMIEMYEMNIPMFVPSKRLLLETGIMNDVGVAPCYGSYADMKRIDIPHTNSPHKFSPNSTNKEDINYWLDFAYFNTKENVIFWESPEDLFRKLSSTNFDDVSLRMKHENRIHREKQLNNWRNLLDTFN
jgi:hypothetical protein